MLTDRDASSVALWPGAICDGDTERRARGAQSAVAIRSVQRLRRPMSAALSAATTSFQVPLAAAPTKAPRSPSGLKLPVKGDVAPPTGAAASRARRVSLNSPPGAPRWSTRVVWVPSGAMRAISRWLVSWSLRSPMTTWTSLTAPGVATVAVPVYRSPDSPATGVRCNVGMASPMTVALPV